jgi:hypothetical protein
MPRGLRIGYSGFPAWRQGAALNEVISIAGTSGAGGSSVDNSFSGWTKVGNRLVIAAAGGHGVGHDNRAVMTDVMADAPAWTQLIAASASVQNDAIHYSPDGYPASRHTYQHSLWVPSVGADGLGRVLLVGFYGTYNAGNSALDVDGLSPLAATPIWDAASTWSPVPLVTGFGHFYDPVTGLIWTISSPGVPQRNFNPATNSWSTPSVTGNFHHRWPVAYDSSRRLLFGLQWGDGQGGSGVTATKFDLTTNTATAITLNSVGGALAQFNADAPEYAAMDYDSTNDEFVFYEAYSDTLRFYVIRPTSGSTWDISIKSIGGGSVTPDPAFGTKGLNFSGVNNRFTYFANLGGFVFMTRATNDLYFLRTA